jgi:hypothetical protein
MTELFAIPAAPPADPRLVPVELDALYDLEALLAAAAALAAGDDDSGLGQPPHRIVELARRRLGEVLGTVR